MSAPLPAPLATLATAATTHLDAPESKLPPVKTTRAPASPRTPSGRPATPDSSPERLDWGSIKDEDGAFAAWARRSGMEEALDSPAAANPAITASMAFTSFEKGESSIQSGRHQEGRADLGKSAIPSEGIVSPAPRWSKLSTKLKSVVLVPARHQSPVADVGGTLSLQVDLSSDWQVVKPKRGRRRLSPPASFRAFNGKDGQAVKPGTRWTSSPAYKAMFWGKCFRSLSTQHRLAHCREPARCFNCLGSGHFARSCRNPPRSSRLSGKGGIRSRLMFPETSIHSRLTFPPLTYAAAVEGEQLQAASGGKPSAQMAHHDRQIADLPEDRPGHGLATVVAGGAMTAEYKKLRAKAVVITSMAGSYKPTLLEMTYAISDQLRLPRWNITVSRYRPEGFFVKFDHPTQRDTAIIVGRVNVGGSTFRIEPWQFVTRPSNWFYHVKIFVENLPMHAWPEEGVMKVLGHLCVFDRTDTTTFTQDNTEIFGFWAWMVNPGRLPCTMATTFFPEGAGRSVPDVATSPTPPAGGEVELIIHLDQYYDWTPIPARSPSSGVSGLPSSVSSNSSDAPGPFFKRFDWTRGLADNRTAPPPRLRVQETCHRPSGGTRRDDHQDDDDNNDPPRREGRYNFNLRGCSVEYLPRHQLHGGRARTRSPRAHHGHRRSEGGRPEARGRNTSRSPPSSRMRQPHRRDDEGWDRRQSRSPPRMLRRQAALDQAGNPKAMGTTSKAMPAPVHAPSILVLDELVPAHGAPPPPCPRHREPGGGGGGGALASAPSFQEEVAPHEVLFGPACRQTETSGPVDCLASQVEGIGLSGAEDSTHEADNGEEAQQATEAFLNKTFPPAPASQLPAPKRSAARVRSASAEPSRRSARQAKNKSIIPVAQRATHKPIRQLDPAGPYEEIGDAALKKYAEMNKAPLPKKAVAAIKAITRLANGGITTATAALAAEA
ncbi:hypothetical protein QOZ80_6AG0515120 [Eleusine coracana subsp. coracana]|nr:hypothetical protein QOZ80_6AG0515120 [Eleusine coracana subsp. coracana]